MVTPPPYARMPELFSLDVPPFTMTSALPVMVTLPSERIPELYLKGPVALPPVTVSLPKPEIVRSFTA